MISGYGSNSTGFRPPAVPLIVNDPYQSIWSMADELNGDWPRHWAGGISELNGMITIDGKCFSFMSIQDNYCEDKLEQYNLDVQATSTLYQFRHSGIELDVMFFTPAILENITLLSLPITFIEFTVRNTDNVQHEIRLYYDNSAEPTINEVSENVSWSKHQTKNVDYLKIGNDLQEFNGDKGADRINWGYWYVVTEHDLDTYTHTVNSYSECWQAFVDGKDIPKFDYNMPRPCKQDWPVTSIFMEIGKLNKTQSQTCKLMIGYD